MNIKLRPVGCCETPETPEPLAPAARTALVTVFKAPAARTALVTVFKAPAARTALVTVFKALADPTRLEIYRLIATQTEPICACDVVDRLR